MTKRKRRRKKLKKKAYIIIILLFIIVCFSFVLIKVDIFKNNNKKESLVDNYVKPIEDSINLYDKSHHKIGSIQAGNEFRVNSNNNSFLNVTGTEFYVLYKDVSFLKLDKKDEHPNYLELGKEITTKNKFNLIYGDYKIEVNKPFKFKVIFTDDDNYYVKLAEKYYKINKNEVSEVNDYNVKDKSSNEISIINFINISESCNNYECYSVEDTKKVLDYIRKNKYHAISVDDFNKWNFGNVRLKENSVLLMSSDNTDIVNNINKSYSNMLNIYTPESHFTYLNNNSSNKPGSNLSAISNYNVYKSTSLDDIKLMIKGDNVQSKFFDGDVATAVPVINYHFFYDLSKGQTDCRESICLEVTKFRKQLDYLRDNGYTALTMNQFVNWIYGNIDVPKKSVLITIDDGAYGTGFHNNNNLIPILEEYKMHATLFLISGWWGTDNYKSSYLEIQSHTNDMHNRGGCGEVQLICASYQEIMDDLSLSVNAIGNNDSFCYPFYEYDDEAIKALKDSGFKIAFGGGSTKATRNSNKYVVPRYPIHDSTTLERFIKMVS